MVSMPTKCSKKLAGSSNSCVRQILTSVSLSFVIATTVSRATFRRSENMHVVRFTVHRTIWGYLVK